MTAPHINPEQRAKNLQDTVRPSATRRVVPAADRQVWGLNPAVVKPEWDEIPELSHSNTAGAGAIVQPRSSHIERIERVRSNSRNKVGRDSATSLTRVRRRISSVLRSPGGFAVSVASFILVVGLSPVIAHEEPTPLNSTPPAVASVQADTAVAE